MATPITALVVSRTGVTGTIACTDDRSRLTGNELHDTAVRSALADSDAVLLTLEPPLPVIEQSLAAVHSTTERPLVLVTAADIDTPQILYRYLPSIDYLIGSTRELDRLVPEVPAESGPHIAELLQMLGARTVCVVEDFGCTIRSDGTQLDIPRFEATAFTDLPGARSAFTGALIHRLLSKKHTLDDPAPGHRKAAASDFTWATAAMVATQAFDGDIPGTMPRAEEIDRIVRLTAERH
jgi:ribokinase